MVLVGGGVVCLAAHERTGLADSRSGVVLEAGSLIVLVEEVCHRVNGGGGRGWKIALNEIEE